MILDLTIVVVGLFACCACCVVSFIISWMKPSPSDTLSMIFIGYISTCFLPQRQILGRKVARALMYMACMYADHGLRLVEGHTAEGHLQLGNLSAIRRWAGAFPPSQREKRRNDLAESLQENRNPFIDDPDLCSAVAW